MGICLELERAGWLTYQNHKALPPHGQSHLGFDAMIIDQHALDIAEHVYRLSLYDGLTAREPVLASPRGIL